jgi:LysR family transcriptional regulator, hypochlorite-specific transcription factor HypT
MELRWLEDIMVLLEEGNMSKAAERRGVTQPAFSRRVRLFEEWLGATLLERKANSIELKPSLIANQGEIKALMQRIQELKNSIASFEPERLDVTVWMQHTLVFSIFPQMAESARSAFPSISFRVRTGNRGECASNFLRDEADLLLSYESGDADFLPFDSTVERYLWGTDALVLVAGRNFSETGAIASALPDDTPAIVYPAYSYFGKVLGKLQKPFATHASTSNPITETAFSVGIKEMVANGLGVAWLPMSLIRNEVNTGQFLILEDTSRRIEFEIALYVKSTNPVSEKIQTIWTDRQRA